MFIWFGIYSAAFPSWCVGQEATGLDAAVALERAFVDVIARCEKSVVAVARARKGTGTAKLTDPMFVPNEFGTGVVVDRQARPQAPTSRETRDSFVVVRRKP